MYLKLIQVQHFWQFRDSLYEGWGRGSDLFYDRRGWAGLSGLWGPIDKRLRRRGHNLRDTGHRTQEQTSGNDAMTWNKYVYSAIWYLRFQSELICAWWQLFPDDDTIDTLLGCNTIRLLTKDNKIFLWVHCHKKINELIPYSQMNK